MTFGAELSVIFLLAVLNGFFSAAEVSLLSIRPTRLDELVATGSRGARAALALRAMPERLLATVQIGITVLGATAGAFGGATLKARLAAWLEAMGAGAFAEELALGMVVAFVSLLSIVVGELVPKSLALRANERTSTLLAPPLLFLARVARPLVWVLTTLSNLVLRLFRDKTTFTESRLSPDELQQLVEESASAGALSPAAGDIASRAIELSQLPVVALLVPRADVVCIPVAADSDRIWAILKQHPYTRYPVVQNGLDDVIGYVVARELTAQLVEQGDVQVQALVREVPFVLERTPAVEALRLLQKQRTKLAVVTDDEGMAAGIVTVGDIAAELLGELLDENDRPQQSIFSVSPGEAVIRGDTPVQQVNRALGIDLPVSAAYTTIAGLLLHESGKILQAGEELSVGEHAAFHVVEASPRQIKRVRLRYGADS